MIGIGARGIALKIAVAMSGGVDSSVAAFLLKEEGHEVVGISMRLTRCNRLGEGSCCTEQDRRDAMEVCEKIGIKHHTVDLTRQFKTEVIEPFVDSYLRGETPSPCILCNESLKFKALLDDAESLGAGILATGHYARIDTDDEGRRVLRRGVDRKKDQSYFLFPALAGGVLARLRFPVGNMRKDEVREVALKARLPVHDKSESQEVCFVPDDDYAQFIEEMRPGSLPGTGNFIDVAGNVLGRHRGIHAYTVGQRRGLGIGFGQRTYVVNIDASRNEIVLGDDAALFRSEMTLRDVVWAADSRPKGRAEVQIRSAHPGAGASIDVDGKGRIRVVFNEPQRAIAPGQAAVFYDGDMVIGGGWIT